MLSKRLRAHLLATACMGFLVCVAALAGYSDSTLHLEQQTPRIEANQQPNGAAESKRKPQEKDQSTDQSRPALQTPPPSHLNEETGNPGAKGAEQGSESWPWLIFGFRLKVTDSLLAIFTLFLVGIGAYQGYQLDRTVTVTKLIGASGIEAARQAVALESPIFALRGATIQRKECAVAFTNYGRSPAIIVADSLAIARVPVLPTKPGYWAQAKYYLPVEKALVGDEYYVVTRVNNITDSDWAEFIAGKEIFWAYGFIDYITFLKTIRREGFCVAFTASPDSRFPSTVSGVRGGPDGYNYNNEITYTTA